MSPPRRSKVDHRVTKRIRDDIQIILSSDEFWFLLQQFSPAVIMGMANPYAGWLVEEIKTAQRSAAKSLFDRGLAQKISEDEIGLDDMLAAMVRVCAHPDHTLVAQFQNAITMDLQRYIHFGGELIVEHFECAPGMYSLTAFQNYEALFAHLSQALQISPTIVGHGSHFQVPEETLLEARKLCADGHPRKALNRFLSVHVHEEKAKRLAKTLSEPVSNSALVMLMNRRKPEMQFVRGFALLEGQDELWMMKPAGEPGKEIVEFTPSNMSAIKERFFEMLP